MFLRETEGKVEAKRRTHFFLQRISGPKDYLGLQVPEVHGDYLRVFPMHMGSCWGPSSVPDGRGRTPAMDK